MWADISREFADSPSQTRVVRFLLENGFGINEEGRIVCNGANHTIYDGDRCLGTTGPPSQHPAQPSGPPPDLSQLPFVEHPPTPITKITGDTIPVSLPGEWHAYTLREAGGVLAHLWTTRIDPDGRILKIEAT